jgi:hypothetical protein
MLEGQGNLKINRAKSKRPLVKTPIASARRRNHQLARNLEAFHGSKEQKSLSCKTGILRCGR